ncbi:ABC transporter transmembrane domain-containing protein [Streptococcus thoraltensis]|uniref:ABC transporter transmembrane domain-containing protein n=1 Tax=Streptococcus thoraltensis TaxID=55085 RepID=UPI001FD267E1|nr:ABC transporter ATP-binding protein [Streptococcus thoraltensis]
MRKRKYQFGYITLLILLGVIFSLPLPYISKLIVDDVLIGGHLQRLWGYMVIIIIIVSIQLILGRLNAISSAHFFQSFLMSLRERVLSENVVNSLNDNSNITTVIFNDTELLVTNIENIVVSFISNICLFLGYLILMFQMSLTLTIVVVITIPIYTLWMVHVGKKLKLLSHEQQNNRDLLLKDLSTIVTNHEVIKIFRLFSKVRKEFEERYKSNYIINSKVRGFQNFIGIITTAFISSTTIIIFIFGVLLVNHNTISVGDLIAFNTYSGVIFSPVTQLVNIISIVSVSKVYEQRIKEYFEKSYQSSKIIDFSNFRSLKCCNLNIFSKNKSLISNIDVTFLKGEHILLRGENGSGKTLFLKTLTNLYQHYTGHICIEKENGTLLILDDQTKLTPTNVIYLSNHQGFILKSLREEFFSKNISDDVIFNILKDIGLYERILTLDKGIYTSGPEISRELSLGEVQKLHLARAMLYKPDVLILDEILSNIDALSIGKILQLLKSRLPNAVIIIVDHHLNISVFFDRVFKINDNLLREE